MLNVEDQLQSEHHLNLNSTIQKVKIEMLLGNFAQLMSSASSNGVEHQLFGSRRVKLSQFLSSSGGIADRWDSGNNTDLNRNLGGTCSFPCLELRGHLPGSQQENRNISLLDVAALNLANPLTTNSSTIDAVPLQLLKNVTNSFQQLLCSRLKASVIALINQTMKLGEFDKANVIRRLVQKRNSIQITTAVTSFSVFQDDAQSSPGKVTKPLILEVIIDVNLLGNMNTVTFKVPGTISAVISPSDYLFQSVNVAFDTVAFLKTMMQEARHLVKKTMKRAARITAAYTQMKRKRARAEQTLDESRTQQSSAISLSSKMQKKDQDLLSSYPEHLRETVAQFLPSQENTVEASIEGFPPQLARTLKALAGHGSEGSMSSSSSGSGQDDQQSAAKRYDDFMAKENSLQFGMGN